MPPTRTPTGRESRDLLARTASTASHLLALLGAVALAVGVMFFVNKREDYLVGILAAVLGVVAIVLSLLANAVARVLIAVFDMLEALLRKRDDLDA